MHDETQQEPKTQLPALIEAPPAESVPMELSPEAARKAVAAMTEVRAIMQEYIGAHLKSGTDYGPIHVGGKDCPNKWTPENCKVKGHWSKPVLFKPGSEKMAQLFSLRAVFSRDDESREMAGSPNGNFFFTCRLIGRDGRIWGEGRGSCSTGDRGRDANSAIKIAEKRAQLDATLRAFSLSDQFTQDLEDGDYTEPAHAAAPKPPPPRQQYQAKSQPPKPVTQNQLSKIHALINSLGLSKEGMDAWSQKQFGRAISSLTSQQASSVIDKLIKRSGEGTPPAQTEKEAAASDKIVDAVYDKAFGPKDGPGTPPAASGGSPPPAGPSGTPTDAPAPSSGRLAVMQEYSKTLKMVQSKVELAELRKFMTVDDRVSGTLRPIIEGLFNEAEAKL